MLGYTASFLIQQTTVGVAGQTWGGGGYGTGSFAFAMKLHGRNDRVAFIIKLEMRGDEGFPSGEVVVLFPIFSKYT